METAATAEAVGRVRRIRRFLWGVTACAMAMYTSLMYNLVGTTMMDGTIPTTSTGGGEGSVSQRSHGPPPSMTIQPFSIEATNGDGDYSYRRRQRPRTLVVVTGSLRAGEVAWQSLYKNLLDVHDADLAVLTENTVPERYRNASLFRRAKYVWWVHKHVHFNDALDAMMMTVMMTTTTTTTKGGNVTNLWRDALMAVHEETAHRCDNTALGGLELPSYGNESVKASGAIIYHMRWVLSNKIQELRLTDVYDRFVITRSDHYYACPFDIDLHIGPVATGRKDAFSTHNPNNDQDDHGNNNNNNNNNHDDILWVPQGQDHRGICDRHFVATNRDILPALNVLAPVLAHPNAYRDVLTAKVYNSEQLLYRRWDEEGLLPRVRRYPRTMFLCSHPQDSTRWKRARDSYGSVLNQTECRVKYPTEYETAMDTCRHYRETGQFRIPATPSSSSVLSWTKRLVEAFNGSPQIVKCPFATGGAG